MSRTADHQKKIIETPVTLTRVAYAEDGKIAEKDLVVACEGAVSQFIDKAVDTTVVAQRQIRMNRNVQKIIEIPQLQYTDDVVGVPVVSCKLHWCAS